MTSGVGDREVYAGDWAQRAAVGVAGILANDPAEAVYPFTRHDGDGQPLDGSKAELHPHLRRRTPIRQPTPSGP